jgi:CRP-like cAMP-binding protein
MSIVNLRPGTPTVALLREVKLFKPFTDSELGQLLQLGELNEYEPHTNIVIEGEMSWGLFVIMGGTVGIFKQNKLTGDLFDVGQLKTGSCFGEMSLIENAPRSATVKSLIEAQLYHISKEAFMGFLNRSSDLKLRFYESCTKLLSSRLREVDENFVISQYQLWKTAIHKREVA